jgi:dienelactone hydrolase
MKAAPRVALLAIVCALGPWPGPALADDVARQELRIPMPAAGPRGLEAVLVRPSTPGRYPLVLINHGSPRDGAKRPHMTPLTYLPHATEFVRRGWAAILVMRRGFGDSGGGWAEDMHGCKNPDYLRAEVAAVADLRAAIDFMSRQPGIDASRIMSVGISAGGFATVALTADPPPGLVAGINFAGGRGSPAPDEVCRPDLLIDAFRFFGRRSRVPMLWIYAENDHFFGPALAEKFRDAFTAGGGIVTFAKAPPFGQDGHLLFANGIPKWTPLVDDFLAKRNLVMRR